MKVELVDNYCPLLVGLDVFAGCIFLRAYTYTVERNDACTNC